jgi:hypothetical protein
MVIDTRMQSPLSAPAERNELHSRQYDFHGFRRADGLYDIEGRMTDCKTYAFPNRWRGEIAAGDPVHDMWARITIDDDFVVVDIEVHTAAGPFEVCPAITPSFAALKGARIGKGWARALKERFGGVHGCTHHVEMLRAMGTVAFQTVFGAREMMKRERSAQSGHDTSGGDAAAAPGVPTKRPGVIDTCHALAADGEVVRQLWPQFYVEKN